MQKKEIDISLKIYEKKFVFIFGSEHKGIKNSVLKNCDEI